MEERIAAAMEYLSDVHNKQQMLNALSQLPADVVAEMFERGLVSI